MYEGKQISGASGQDLNVNGILPSICGPWPERMASSPHRLVPEGIFYLWNLTILLESLPHTLK